MKLRTFLLTLLFLALPACATARAGGVNLDQAGKITCGSAAAVVAVCDAGGGKPDVCNLARMALGFCGQVAPAGQGFGLIAAGSGYDPRARGLTQSCFRLDAVNGPLTCVPIDFSADPATAEPLSPEFVALFEKRWGKCTFNTCSKDTPPRFFKRWLGPGNEVRSTVADALRWACRSGMLGTLHDPSCEPTETQIVDCQATGDRIWEAYLRAEIPGFRSDNRWVISDQSKPQGNFEEKHPFWGITWYLHNTATPPPPPPPPVSDGKADCSAVKLPAPGAPQYVGYFAGTNSTGSAAVVVECRGGSLPPVPPPRPTLSSKSRAVFAKVCTWLRGDRRRQCAEAIAEWFGLDALDAQISGNTEGVP